MAQKTTTKRGGKEAEAPKPRGRQAREAQDERADARGGFFHRLGVLASDVKGLVPSIKGKSWASVAFAVDNAGLLANEREQYAVGAGFRELINNVFDAGGTQCDIVVDVENNQVIITGNGKPIQNVEELSTLFSVAKRHNKVVEDVDGNVRVIIGEKGRGRLAASVDCDEAYWTSAFGEFKVEFVNGTDLRIASRKTPSRKVEKGKTVVVMKRGKSNPYDAKWIREFLCETYKYFGGQNFRISLDGEEIPMKEFKPTSRILVAPSDVEVKNQIRTTAYYGRGNANYYLVDSSVSDADFYTFAGENSRVQVVSVHYDPTGKDDVEFLAQRVPVNNHEQYHNVGNFVVDSTFALRPDRHSFAEWRVGNDLLVTDVGVLLACAAECAFGSFLESDEYVRLGWNKRDNPHYNRVLAFLRHNIVSDSIRLPELEVGAFVPQEDGSARRVSTTLGQLHSSEREIVIIDFRRLNSSLLELDSLSDAVHKGKAIILVGEEANVIEQLLKNLGAKKVHGQHSPEAGRVLSGIDGTTKFAVRKTAEMDIPLVNTLERALKLLSVQAKVAVAEYVGKSGNEDSVAYVNGKICIVRGSRGYNELVESSFDVARFMLTTADSLVKAIAEKEYGEQIDERQTHEQLQLCAYAQLITAVTQQLYES